MKLCVVTWVTVALLSGLAFAGCLELYDDDHDEAVTAREAVETAHFHHERSFDDPFQVLGLFGIGMPTANDDEWLSYGNLSYQKQETLQHAHEGRLARWGIVHEVAGQDTPRMTGYAGQRASTGPQISFGDNLQDAPYLLEVPGHVPLDLDGGWLDSDEALQNLGHARTQSLLEDNAAGLIMILQHVETRDDPHWFIQLTPHDGSDVIAHFMDAGDGRIVDPDELYPRLPAEHHEETVMFPYSETRWTFQAEDDLRFSHLSVQVEGEDPDTTIPTEVRARLQAPAPHGGTTELEGEWPEPLGATIPHRGGGEYELILNTNPAIGGPTLDDPLASGIRITLCMDGQHPDPLGLHPRGECL